MYKSCATRSYSGSTRFIGKTELIEIETSSVSFVTPISVSFCLDVLHSVLFTQCLF